MFERAHHELIRKVLEAFNTKLLLETGSLFAGGTALSLLLGEYRESRDVDFLISDPAGYQVLRKIVWNSGLSMILPNLPALGSVRADRYGVRAVVSVEGNPIKVEFVSENRIALTAGPDLVCGVPTLDRVGLYAEKLLANVDRVDDRSASGRDAIDLAAMLAHWGPIPAPSWQSVAVAYGEGVARAALVRAVTLFESDDYLSRCLQGLQMPETATQWIMPALRGALAPDGPTIEGRKRWSP